MRRTQLVLAVAVVMIAALMVVAAPAMAQDRDDRNNNNRFVSHDVEQEADSGDVDQDFDVSGTGDNSNQTAGIQGVANTGNAQNFIGVSDGFGDNFNDFDNGDLWWWDDWWWWDDGFDNGGFEFDEVGSSIELSPTNITSSDQQVDEAATASG
jgi:hypothetical protein